MKPNWFLQKQFRQARNRNVRFSLKAITANYYFFSSLPAQFAGFNYTRSNYFYHKSSIRGLIQSPVRPPIVPDRRRPGLGDPWWAVIVHRSGISLIITDPRNSTRVTPLFNLLIMFVLVFISLVSLVRIRVASAAERRPSSLLSFTRNITFSLTVFVVSCLTFAARARAPRAAHAAPLVRSRRPPAVSICR